MTDIHAVKPERGNVVHLFLDGYQPGPKPRPHADASGMCGAPLMSRILDTEPRPTVPLADAIKWGNTKPHRNDPRPAWTWCRPCLGHAATHEGFAHYLVNLIVEAS